MRICVEGIMGSGKSSLVKGLQCAENFNVFDEAVMFDDEVDNGFFTQIKFLKSRYDQWKSYAPDFFNVYDRSVWSDSVFARIGLSYGDLSCSEFDLYLATRRIFLESAPLPDVIFFLDIETEQAMNRVKARGNIDQDVNYGFLLRQKVAYELFLEDMETRGVEVFCIDSCDSKENILKSVITMTRDFSTTNREKQYGKLGYTKCI